MRYLPVFFVLDCSESVIGKNLRKMTNGLQMIIGDLGKDPHTLETVQVSTIAFAGVARTIVPLHEITSFYPPHLPVGNGTGLGAALHELTVQIDTQVRKTTHEAKGDWKSAVHLLTDGHPTDDITAEMKRWKDHYVRKANLIVVNLGSSTDLNILW